MDEIDILRARVELLREAHHMANQSLRTAWAVAEREGRDTNWPGVRSSLMASLEASHAALRALEFTPVIEVKTAPADQSDAGRNAVIEERNQFRVLLDDLFHSQPVMLDTPHHIVDLFNKLSALVYSEGKQGVIDARRALTAAPPREPQ